jgi:molecular chaperone GrpE
MSRKPEHESHELVPPDHDPSAQETEEAVSQSLEGGAEEVVHELEDEHISVHKRLADAERQVLLAQAELENFRKRMHREMETQLKYANLPLIRDLLDVIDNLHRATESAAADASQTESPSNQALLAGVKLVLQQMETVFEKYGCRVIKSTGQPFDPNIHEAISQMASPEFPAGTVAQEVAVGYLLHDRVVRPSCVIVSTGSK